MKIIMTGGGTGGHINPALQIANEIRKISPDTEISFVGTKRGIEHTLVPKQGYEIDEVEVQGFRRSFSPKAIKANLKALKLSFTSVREAKKILKKRMPDVVVGTGGYVSWPTVKAASKMGIPCLIHEQNTYPGVTTKKLVKYASVICVSFESSRKYFSSKDNEKIILTGNPVNTEKISKEDARMKLGLSPDEPYILSFGGSMGARRVNELCLEMMETYSAPKHIRHDHAIGRTEFEKFSSLAKEKGLDKNDRLTIAEYFYDMAVRQAAADVIICRAGAITLAELALRGKAAIYIPSPYVAEDHQYKNARLLADAGAGIVFREAELTCDGLTSAVDDLLNNPNKRMRMEDSVRQFAMEDSGRRIAGEVLRLAEEHC
ncbi:MAG: undecaprenyldiphospho-muramoylpentapeptide beta-N-acetylglucosaminyltransferase [Clostridia bacterium]|nr:undecaprenyldiphospho-muramoylpentapeptide beta-N-acetylglucosaminyltransferase [Clostridia bacterium]